MTSVLQGHGTCQEAQGRGSAVTHPFPSDTSISQQSLEAAHTALRQDDTELSPKPASSETWKRDHKWRVLVCFESPGWRERESRGSANERGRVVSCVSRAAHDLSSLPELRAEEFAVGQTDSAFLWKLFPTVHRELSLFVVVVNN